MIIVSQSLHWLQMHILFQFEILLLSMMYEQYLLAERVNLEVMAQMLVYSCCLISWQNKANEITLILII